jgi:hypothetical protein
MLWIFSLLSSVSALISGPDAEPKVLRHGLSADYWSRAPLDHDWRAELDDRWEE